VTVWPRSGQCRLHRSDVPHRRLFILHLATRRCRNSADSHSESP